MDEQAIATADFNARHWNFSTSGPINPSSDAHFQMLTQLLQAAYNPYKPTVLNWPRLDAQTLASRHHAALAPALFRFEDRCGLGFSHLRAYRDRAGFGWA